EADRFRHDAAQRHEAARGPDAGGADAGRSAEAARSARDARRAVAGGAPAAVGPAAAAGLVPGSGAARQVRNVPGGRPARPQREARTSGTASRAPPLVLALRCGLAAECPPGTDSKLQRTRAVHKSAAGCGAVPDLAAVFRPPAPGPGRDADLRVRVHLR